MGPRLVVLAAIAPLAAAVMACGQTAEAPRAPADASTPPPTSAPDLDESSTLARIANGAYRFSPQFIPIARAPYESIAASGTRVNVWVSAGDAPSYERISPEKFGSRVNLTPGAVIVREVIQNGATVKLTIIVKGPSGYSPALGDLWFAVTEPNGTPLSSQGAPLTGRLSECATCHSLRWDDGYLFGVPQAERIEHDDASVSAPDAGVTAPPSSSPPSDVCGDFICTLGESCVTCPSDCGPCEPGDDHGGDRGASGGGPGPS